MRDQSESSEAAQSTPGCCTGCKPATHTDHYEGHHQSRFLMIYAILIGLAWVVAEMYPAYGDPIILAAMAVGLLPILKRAVRNARTGNPFSIETLMSVAAIGAVFVGAAHEAAVVILLFLVGETLEGFAGQRASANISDLASLIPKTALLERDGRIEEIAADTLTPGAIILVRPGDRIPADGEIVEGQSAIDEAPVTGESVPKQKQIGDTVFAGTINGDGVVRVRVTAAASDNTIARIIRLVEEAQESKSPTERFINRFSRYYTPGVLILALLIAVVPPLVIDGYWQEWIYKALAILLIGCPCALVISTPAAVAAGLSAGARRGLLIKGGAILEQLRTVTYVAFDKTGTLTEGKPVVTDVVAFETDEAEIVSLAAAVEIGSSHPLAIAILDHARKQNLSIPAASNSQAVAGKGVIGHVAGQNVGLYSPSATAAVASISDAQHQQIERFNDEGKTVSVLLVDTRLSGLLAIRDEPRGDARTGVQALSKTGIKTIMLTGDTKRTAEAIGNTLGMTDVRAELLPQDKQIAVEELQKTGNVVAKVGDGINDAPALATADIGIAMGGGTDVALETADAAILHGRVTDIFNMIDLSKGVMRNIHQNIAISIGLKLVFLATTVAGVTGLWPAIMADTGATVLVTANAMRLLRWEASTR